LKPAVALLEEKAAAVQWEPEEEEDVKGCNLMQFMKNSKNDRCTYFKKRKLEYVTEF